MLENIAKQKLLETVKELFDEAVSYDASWQRKAREAFEFRNNNQWDNLEKDVLSKERRPALTMNVIKSHIDLIMGLNEDIKKRYVSSPVSSDDSFLCEVINNIIYWLYQKNDWESEEDNAYESSLISGRGWVALDYDIDERSMNDIKITLTSIPVHEVRVDPSARKRDLSDASYIVWDRWLSLEDFCIKYPGYEPKAREAFTTNLWPRIDTLGMLESGNQAHDINDTSDYSDPLDIGYYDTKKRQIRIVHMEYWKYEKTNFVYDHTVNAWRAVEENLDDFKIKWQQAFPNVEMVIESQIQKNIYWLQFCGNDVLLHAKSPIKYPGFSIVPCFLYSDISRRTGYHFGIVELMKDAQREINKRTSQTLNLFNQQVQPGVYAESKAFVNANQAEESIKEAGSVTWLQDGAISQNRFQERTVPTFPSAVLQMGEYAREMLRHITGINPDLLGMNDKRQEAGIVVQLRQQQGMAILKPAFKAYSEMKKQIFERLVRIVMEHMPLPQIKKILGEGDRYVIGGSIITDTTSGASCNFGNVSDVAYDIDAEPENNSLTANALEAATFIEMQKNGIPVDPRVIISKTNLPISEKLQWIKYIEESQESQAKTAQQAFDLEMSKIKNQHDQAMARLKLDGLIAKQKNEAVQEKDALQAAIEREKLNVQTERDKQTAQLKMLQIVSAVRSDQEEARRKMIEMMLSADHDRKRLILDIAEVMANASFRSIELQVKALTDMYREALTSETLNAVEETKLAGKVFDILVRGAESKTAAETDLIKSNMDLSGKLKIEKIKAETAKVTAKESKNNGKEGTT